MSLRKMAALACAGLAAVGVVTAVQVSGAPPAAAATEVYTLPSSGSITVQGRGNGHGRGMSQYGAHGAAQKGLTYKQIVAFYYPGTTLTTLSSPVIKVGLESLGSTPATVVQSENDGIRMIRLSDGSTRVAALNSTGVKWFRLVNSGSSLLLQKTANGSTWTTIGSPITEGVALSSDDGATRLITATGSGSFKDYRGALGRMPGQKTTVNRLTLDQYVQGVVPREMPASWEPQALQAQAVAARTYSYYEVKHPRSAGNYDICDTQNCQVYGGLNEDSRANAAVQATARQVLTYNGSPAFTEFTSSNGGWSAAGDQPYLKAKQDPYDAAVSPYIPWTQSVSVATIASGSGIAHPSSIGITARDGHGAYGGRVVTGYVAGKNASGAAVKKTYSGDDLRWVLGLKERWFTISQARPGPVQGLKVECGDASGWVSWTPPANHGASAISGYRIAAGSRVIDASAAKRRVFVGPERNGVVTRFTVTPKNSYGWGTAASVTCRPMPQTGGFTALTPTRIFATSTPVKAGSAYTYTVRGRGGVPSTAKAVQIALTIARPTASGQLKVHVSGVTSDQSTGIRYVAGQSRTVLLTVPLTPSGRVQFVPNAGAVNLLGTRVGWSAPAKGGSFSFRTASSLPTVSGASAAGKKLSLAGRPGVTKSTQAVVVQVQAHNPAAAGWVRILPDGSTNRTAAQLYLPAHSYGYTTAIVPLSAARALRVAASNRSISVSLALIGTVGPRRAGGKLEAVPLVSNRGLWSSRPAFTVGNAARTIPLNGAPQVPVKGLKAVLVGITATGTREGHLQYRPSGSSGPWVTIAWVNRASTTYTALIPLAKGKRVDLRTVGPAASVRIDTLGYVTAG